MNRLVFPQNILIAADRRRKNIGEIYKPTIPSKQVVRESNNEQGFDLDADIVLFAFDNTPYTADRD